MRVVQDLLLDDDDDDDFLATNLPNVSALQWNKEPSNQHGGSRPGRSANFNRNTASGDAKLKRDYFGPNPTYGEDIFRRRFRMPRCLFLEIVDAIGASDAVMRQRFDATKKPGLTCL